MTPPSRRSRGKCKGPSGRVMAEPDPVHQASSEAANQRGKERRRPAVAAVVSLASILAAHWSASWLHSSRRRAGYLRFQPITRTFGQDAAHRPQEPIDASMQEQAKLGGVGRMAGGAVGGEVVLPRPDVVLRLAAGALESLVKVLGAAALKVGDNKAGCRCLRAPLRGGR